MGSVSDATSEAWRELTALIAASPVTVSVRAPDARSTTATRLALGTDSTLGALARHSSGLLVDDGWLRILGGSSSDGLPGLDQASAPGQGLLIVAYDVLGGVFALDGGALGPGDGSVHHFSVDSLRWEDLGLGHTAFVRAMLEGAGADFSDALRWPGWEAEVRQLAPAQGLDLYPPPFTAEGKDLSTVSRRPVPFPELLALHNEVLTRIDPEAAPLVPLPDLP